MTRSLRRHAIALAAAMIISFTALLCITRPAVAQPADPAPDEALATDTFIPKAPDDASPATSELPPVVVTQPKAVPSPKKVAAKKPAKAAPATAAATPAAGEPASDGVTAGRAGPVGNLNVDYHVSDATIATRTTTPIFDTPAGIQVVPRALIDDTKAATVGEALGWVSSVISEPYLGAFDFFLLRGFRQSAVYRNGLRIGPSSEFFGTDYDTANVQSIEVLKGPASVLYGRNEPGGVINLTTKQPQAAPAYSVEQQVGSFDTYRTLLDATGPLAQDRSLLYRFSAAYENSGSFRDFVETEKYDIASAVTWRPQAGTEMTFDFEVLNNDFKNDFGIPVIGRRPAPVPVSLSLGDPNDPTDNIFNLYLGYNLKQKLGDYWTLNGRFLGHRGSFDTLDVAPSFFDEASGIQTRRLYRQYLDQDDYAGNVDLVGKFAFPGMTHEVLFGTDYSYSTGQYFVSGYLTDDPQLDLDIFHPSYGLDPGLFRGIRDGTIPPSSDGFSPIHRVFREENIGVYVQDHVTLWDTLHILAGGRYDWAEYGTAFALESDSFAGLEPPRHLDEAWSPRVGAVYELTPWLNVYGSYSRSFGVSNGVSFDDPSKRFPPEIATQYEGGLKAEFFNKALSATLAVYELTKENILISDDTAPIPLESVSGTVRSRGVEFDIAGHITDEIGVTGSYAYTDVKILEAGILFDGTTTAGNRWPDVPYNAAALWLKYDVNGWKAREGASFGVGMRYVGEREGDEANSFELPAYTTFDAAVSYRWRIENGAHMTAALNLTNLFDTTYYASSEFYGECLPKNCVFPGEPFAVLGSLKVEW